MFKNIEISEINDDRVVKSLWVLLIGSLVFALFTIGFTFGADEGGFNGLIVLYAIMQLIFLGWPAWGLLLFVFYLIERFTLGKRSTTKTVGILFLIEMILPLILLLVSVLNDRLNFSMVFMSSGTLITQWVRWRYLKRENRMYNFVK
ncbi:MAG: hypothetical protein GQ574_14370 [Crocinitomix sp.]|nr:hypothetical protein [Crocinitomix sp.]